jgi:hypothetical protein
LRGTDLEVLSNLTDETLEGELADKELRRLLVATNLAERDGTRPEAVRLLDTASHVLGSRGGGQRRYVERGEVITRTAGCLRAADLAALVASCLRGALPGKETKSETAMGADGETERTTSGLAGGLLRTRRQRA